MSDSQDGLEFFKGLLFGGAVGAFLALLYAPKSGEEFREDVLKNVLQAREDLETKLERVQKQAEVLLAEARAQLASLKTQQEQQPEETAKAAAKGSAPGKRKNVRRTAKK